MNRPIDPEKPPARSAGLIIALALGVLVVYACAALLVMHFVPPPRGPQDYLVAGTVATLFSLVALFAVLLAVRRK